MDKRKRRGNGTDFSNSIQQSRRREQNPNTMKEKKIKSVYKGGNKERTRESKVKEGFFDGHSM